MSGTYTQEKCGEDSTPLSNAPEARCGLRHSGRRSAGSSSQAPYSSFRRKRQNSYISLLVLSKLQPLRWVAIWFQPLLREKIWKKRALGTRNSAYAPEKAFCFCVPFADSTSRKERPSGGRLIGLPNRTARREVVLFAPVEYLAYGIRTMFVLLRAVVADAHIGHIKRCTCGTMQVSPPTNAVHLRSSRFLSAVSIGCGRETSQAKRPKVRESGA